MRSFSIRWATTRRCCLRTRCIRRTRRALWGAGRPRKSRWQLSRRAGASASTFMARLICGTRRTSGVPSPTSGANASAELVVPRSIPMAKRARSFVKNYTSGGGRLLFRADLELNLPSAIGVRVPHPKLKDAEFRDDRADADRHHLPHRNVQCWDRDFEQASVIKLALGVGENL